MYIYISNVNAYIRNEKKYQINNLSFYIKKLEREQNKPKASGRKKNNKDKSICQ